jgi:hypothetical protein
MSYQFNSFSDMIEYLNGHTSDGYRNDIKRDFEIDVSPDMPELEIKYFWRYLVQGNQKGISDKAELIKYANEGLSRFKEMFPTLPGSDASMIKQGKKNKPAAKPKSAAKTKTIYQDGSIVFSDKHQKYEGFKDNKVVVRCKTVDKVKANMTKLYDITVFFE